MLGPSFPPISRIWLSFGVIWLRVLFLFSLGCLLPNPRRLPPHPVSFSRRFSLLTLSRSQALISCSYPAGQQVALPHFSLTFPLILPHKILPKFLLIIPSRLFLQHFASALFLPLAFSFTITHHLLHTVQRPLLCSTCLSAVSHYPTGSDLFLAFSAHTQALPKPTCPLRLSCATTLL